MPVSKTIRFPDDQDAWIESEINDFRSYTSIVVEAVALLRAQRVPKPRLEDKTSTGKIRK